jgi:hypothetical protein
MRDIVSFFDRGDTLEGLRDAHLLQAKEVAVDHLRSRLF